MAPQSSRLPPVSRSLQVLAVIVLALIAAVTLHQLQVVRASIVDDAERQMARLDMVFAEQTGRAVESVDLLVRNAVDAWQDRQGEGDPDGTPDPHIFNDWLARRASGIRQANAIMIADASGKIINASSPRAPALLWAQGQALLDRYRDGAQGLLISAPFRMQDGTWTALLSRPILAPATEGAAPHLIGIAAGALDLAYFEDFYRAVDLTENGAINLHHRDGTVLARYPHVDAAIGTSFADMPPFKDILSTQQAGTLVMDSPLDGSIRVVAIRALKAFPLAVVVSVDESRLLAGWWRQTWLFVATAILVSLLTVGLLLRLSQRSRQVERLLGETHAAAATAEETNRQLRTQMAERERAEAALRQAQRMEAIGQLTGGVAHDFNNLLTVLIGNIDMMERDPDQPKAAKERLTAMRSAAMRGATLTSHLLAFARRQPLVPRAVDLNAVVNGMRDLLASALGGRVRVNLELADSLWPAMVDPTQIELVILNLAINARDAMDRVGVLTVVTENRLLGAPDQPEEPSPGAYVMVSVRDTGSGMSPEVRARVFEPFFTTKPLGVGSGLGLSQVVGTARQSGGGVRIDTAPGNGTTVHVFLPRASVPAERAPLLPAASSAHGRAATVLLVDDDEAVRTVTGAVLRDLGYGVHEAASGAVALRILETEAPIQLLLTDLAMPFMTGAQLAQAARARRPSLPVVFISGYADPEGLAGAVPLHRLVRKPFRPGELRDQIEASLGGMEVGQAR